MKKVTFLALMVFLSITIIIFSFSWLISEEDQNNNQTSLDNNQVVNNKNIFDENQAIKNINSNINTDITENINNNNNQKSLFSSLEVSKHSSIDDCYLIINEKVYNVSSFISNHPGGQNIMAENCGREVSGLFASIHSNIAWDLLREYYIGDLVLQ